MKGISCKMGDAFFNARLHQTITITAEILFPVITDLINPGTYQKVDAMAKSHYEFKKRQKELAKKKKQEEKKQRKLENNVAETDETDETENDPTPSMEDR